VASNDTESATGFYADTMADDNSDPEINSLRNPGPGATANSPLSMPWPAWKIILKRVYTMWGFHNLSLLGAGVAFFTFLALTPLIAATVMIYGLVGNVEMVQRQIASLTTVLPAEARSLIEEQLISVVTTSTGVTGFALVIALFFAIYGGMRAANGLVGALNIINEEHESRGIIALTLRVAALTLAAIFIALIGISSAGTFAWLQMQTQGLIGPGWEILFKILAWTVSILLGSAGFALIMRYGPDRRPARWRWLAPGALVATFLWIATSFGFALYVAYVSDYNATYGSLSAIVVFLMWLFLSAYGVLAGALLNAEIERQTTVDSTTGPVRPTGERGAVLADLAEGDLSIEQWLHKSQRRAASRQIHQMRKRS
jgi:membrane protein